MKLTESKLKELIVEVLNEIRVRPTPPEALTPEQLDKIHELILSGNEENMNMAQSLIDGFGGDPNYVENYIEYETTGDLEKLGNKHAELYDYYTYSSDPKGTIYKGAKQGMDPREAEAQKRAIDAEAEALIDKKFARTYPEGEPRHHGDKERDPLYGRRGDAYWQMKDRYIHNREPTDSRWSRDTFLFPQKKKPIVKDKSRGRNY